MLALYQDYRMYAKKISPSGRLTYWGVLNTWSHPFRTSNKRSHYQTIQLLYKSPVCPWMAVHCAWAQKRLFAGAGVIFSAQCQEQQHGRRNMWHQILHECAKIKQRTCCIHPFVAHLSPGPVCVWWPGETLHMMKFWHFFKTISNENCSWNIVASVSNAST